MRLALYATVVLTAGCVSPSAAPDAGSRPDAPTEHDAAAPCAPRIVRVTASGDDGNVPPNVLDGDYGTRWSAEGDGQWIALTLACPIDVSTVSIAFYLGGERRSTLSIEGSLGGGTPVTLLDHVSASGTGTELEPFAFARTRLDTVRIVGHGNELNAWNSYTEIRIGGVAGPGETCGNSRRETGEACDGADLGGASCASEGLGAGALSCRADCSALDTSGCTGAPADPVVVVFAESWDSATRVDPWSPSYRAGWIHDDLVRLVSTPERGQSLEMEFPAGTRGSSHGIGSYHIYLPGYYRELYLSWEYFVPGSFDFGYRYPPETRRVGGGKFFGGFAGDRQCAIPNNVDPNTDATDPDGWVSMFLFREFEPGRQRIGTYNYFKSTSYDYGGWPNGSPVADIVRDRWRRLAIRMRVNDPGEANGIYEVFDDDVLVYQQTDVIYVNEVHPEFLIDSIYLNNFFGGSEPSIVTQSMRFDNLVAFHYPPGSPEHRAGPSEAGRRITVPTITSSVHPTPPNQFTETTYTRPSGEVRSHCGFYHTLQDADHFRTATIEVADATYIDIDVTSFEPDRGVTAPGWKQTLRIYEGTGADRRLLRTYVNGTFTTVPSSIRASGNAVTLEWQAGRGHNGGFTLRYTSDGTGGGADFACSEDYVVN